MASKKKKFTVVLIDKATKKELCSWNVSFPGKKKDMRDQAYTTYLAVAALDVERKLIEKSLEFKWEEKK